MPLSIKEQIDILSGVESPSGYTFEQYIEQVAVNACENFFTNTKTSTDIESRNYITLMSRLCKELLTQSGRYNNQLAKILISIYADTGTIAQVQVADDDGWVNFIENNILTSLETLAGVIAEQKAAYDALP